MQLWAASAAGSPAAAAVAGASAAPRLATAAATQLTHITHQYTYYAFLLKLHASGTLLSPSLLPLSQPLAARAAYCRRPGGLLLVSLRRTAAAGGETRPSEEGAMVCQQAAVEGAM